MQTDIDSEIRMLLVEDDPDSGEALQDMLRRRDVAVTMTQGAEEALRRFSPDAFDVIVADIRLQGMSGTDLLRHVRKD